MKQQKLGTQPMRLGDLLNHSHRVPFDKLCLSLPIERYKETVLSSDLFNALFDDNLNNNGDSVLFVDQALLNESNLYYEAYIAKFKQVPSRGNWHDFFNALVWSKLPNTKSTFNKLHNQEIGQHGEKKRTPIRDRLTHFDECGLVIFTDNEQLKHDCADHNWADLFVKHKTSWAINTEIIIVGHAIWEMLLNPFIGLTGKARFIDVSTDTLRELSDDISQQNYQQADYFINQHLAVNDVLSQSKPWLPLPVLGIPGWSTFPQTDEFYRNADYFMPKRFKNAR